MRATPLLPYSIAMAWDGQVGSPVLTSAKSTLDRLNYTPEEAAANENKLAGAVRTILECLGEDPDRDGLKDTPKRYARALLWMTKGYEERLTGA